MTDAHSGGRLVRLLGLLLVAALVVAAVAVWRALDPAAIRVETERRLASLLGQPVVIGGMSVSLVPRPALVGTSVRIGDEGRAAPAADLDRIRIVPRLRSLLTRTIVMEGVRLEGFFISVLRDHEGRWHAPIGIPIAPPSAGAGPRWAIDRIELRNGRMDVFEADRTGALRPSIAIDAIDADLIVGNAGRRLLVEPATFEIHGGSHRGSLALDLSGAPARWSLDGTVEDLEVGRFLSALTGADERLDGRGTVTAAVRGRIGDPLAAMAGTVRVIVVDGVVRDFPLLATISRALRLAESGAGDTRFDRLSATLAIGGGQASTDDLLLEAEEVRITAAGRVGFDRSLDLAGHAVFSQERSAEMIRSIRELAVMRNARGELEIPLTISGTAGDPAIAFDLGPVLGGVIEEELRRRLQRFFDGPP